MATYRYQALNATGAEVSGTVEAPDPRAALLQVRELGLHPLDTAPAGTSRAGKPAGDSIRRRGRRVRSSDLTVFTRQLANLVGGGLPMLRTLDALIENTENARLYELLSTVRQDVADGGSLHDALGRHPRVFPPLYLGLVASGEASGELSGVLNRLADFLEQDLERRTQIRAALTYPALLVTVGGLIVTAMITFLVPKFKVLFDEFDRALPLSTQLVLGMSTFIGRWWGLLLAGLVALVAGHRHWTRTATGRYVWDTWRLRWPILGRLHHRAATARLARTLATLLHGGVSILDALEHVEAVVDNARLAAAIARIRDGVREGESLGLEIRRNGEFPALLGQMVLVGEETGDVDGALLTVADAFDVEVSNTLKGLIALVEPAIIIVMGGVVAMIVFAMLMPIFQMSAGLG